MSPHDADELHALRTRAYGPHADIHDDEDALRRLQQLEAAVGVHVKEQPEPAEQHEESEMADAAASVDPAHAAIDGEVTSVEQPRASTGWRPKRLALWWLASVLIAVIVAVSVTAFVSRRVQADPREVAVLGVDRAYVIPDFYGSDSESLGFVPLHGLRVISTTVPWMGSVVDRCVSVFDESTVVITSDSISGEVWSGCGAGAFDPTIEIKVSTEMPAELRSEFPVGTALQFILEESEVIVLSDLER